MLSRFGTKRVKFLVLIIQSFEKDTNEKNKYNEKL